jgi:polar amino acid transport system substrate-binding protein
MASDARQRGTPRGFRVAHSRSKIGLLLLPAMLFLLIAWPAAARAAQPAAQNTAAFVPSFWDPHHRTAKPSLNGLRSLRFLTEDDYPPFHFALPDGTLSGFDVDLARAICEQLNISCTIQARRFDTLIDALNNDQGDAVIAALRIDGQSRAKLDFSQPYYTTPARFVSLKPLEQAPATPESLRGKAVGVQAMSAHEAYLKAFFPDTVQKAYGSQQELRSALVKGEIDTIFADGISLSLWLNSEEGRSCCRFRGGPFLDANFFGEGAGVAVKKGNSQLRRALNWALAALAERGTYTDLYLKYFPVGFY